MSQNEPLAAELEAQALELAARMRARADDDILALARLLVSKDEPVLILDFWACQRVFDGNGPGAAPGR